MDIGAAAGFEPQTSWSTVLGHIHQTTTPLRDVTQNFAQIYPHQETFKAIAIGKT